MEAQSSIALIVGVSSMIGFSLAEALRKPTTQASSWTIYGVARRRRPTWFPATLIDRYLEFDLLDFEATKQQLSLLSNQVTNIFWVTRKSCETEKANIIANSTMVNNVLKVLVSKSPSKLRHFALVTGTKHYLGPIFDPIFSGQVTPHEAPFLEEMPRLPCPNFYYDLEDLLASYHTKFTYSVHRSSLILGASTRSTNNLLNSLFIYALICRHEGIPFRYNGNKFMWEHFCDATDAELLAEQLIWASVSEKAHNHAFNCTNGDVFTWKSFWMLLCEIFNLEFVPFDETEKFDFLEEMQDKGKVWDSIVEENQLLKTRLEEMVNFGSNVTIMNFKNQHVCSMTKSREFGFHGFQDSCKSVKKWVEKLREMNIIPKQ